MGLDSIILIKLLNLLPFLAAGFFVAKGLTQGVLLARRFGIDPQIELCELRG